ncbi:13583_t:CDS:2, partial [Racocetra persica]
MKEQKQIYIGFAQSTLRNKRAALRKAALGSNKITDWIFYDLSNSSTKNSMNNIHNIENENECDDILFYNFSDDKDDEHQIRRKSPDLSIHISEFICESIGCLCLLEEDKVMNDLLPNNERIPYNEMCVMNLKDEGKQPLLRDRKMPDGSVHVMTFVDEDSIKKPKGIQHILEEHSL